MRGDRPAREPRRSRLTAAAPHARGSTQTTIGSDGAVHGCPACAGIDPRSVRRCYATRRLPRMRGDRPGRGAPTLSRRMAAPHARGSTRGREACAVHGRGCPACAGIDPSQCRSHRSSVGAAPHARGSTLRAVVLGHELVGCPACAGIDPRARLTAATRPRLPRMRGDRPVFRRKSAELSTAAPHARGSTLRPS